MFQSAAFDGFNGVPGGYAEGANESSDDNLLAPPIFEEIDEILAPPVYAEPHQDTSEPSTSGASVHGAINSLKNGATQIETENEPSEKCNKNQLTVAGAQQLYTLMVRNVVCKFQVNRHVDLRSLAHSTGNVVYERGTGRAKLQLRNPRCFVDISAKGDVLIKANRSESESKWAAVKVGRCVLRSSPNENRPLRILNYAVCNIMATAYLPYGVKLAEMKTILGNINIQYEPELHPGLHWRMTEFGKAFINVFTTGSVVITGVTSVDHVLRVLEIVAETTKRFKDLTRPKNAKILLTKPLLQDFYADELCDDDEDLENGDIDVVDDWRAASIRYGMPKRIARQFAEFTMHDEWAAKEEYHLDDEHDDEIDPELEARRQARHVPPARGVQRAKEATSWSSTDATTTENEMSRVESNFVSNDVHSDQDDDDDFEDVA